VVEANGLHSHTLHFHVHKLVLFVHAVNAADLLAFPRNSQVEAFITELDLGDCSSRAVLDWSFESNRFLLRPNVVDNHSSVRKAHTKHKTVWVEFNRCNCNLSLHSDKQLTVLDVVQGPSAVIRAHDYVIADGMVAKASNILVAFNFVEHFA